MMIIKFSLACPAPIHHGVKPGFRPEPARPRPALFGTTRQTNAT